MAQTDVVIVGAGVIGLSCALELHAIGMRVTVLERDTAARQASWAAAGMLAGHDPANPVALQTLADLSLSLYPAFLERIAALGGATVPIETEWAMEPSRDPNAEPQQDLPQLKAPGFARIAEQSLDPRKLAAALLQAVRSAGIDLREHTPVRSWTTSTNGAELDANGETFTAGYALDCSGAWSGPPVKPAKGQMLRLSAPGALTSSSFGNMVVRAPGIYLVPRLDGTVVIGATIEDAGFDTRTNDADLRSLRERAAALIPAMHDAPEVERWAGLRPDTPDHLPLLGFVQDRRLVASGHFRNGILLAPATARVMTRLIQHQTPEVDLVPFSPDRFALAQ